MTKVFKFKNNLLELEIAGKKFEVDVLDKALLDDYIPLQKRAEKFNKEIQAGTKEQNVEAVAELMEIQAAAIDTFLGEGATLEIFEQRKINLLDLVDILGFINDEVDKFQKQNLEKREQYSPNRAARRNK